MAGLWIVGLFARLVDLQVVRKDDFVKRARRQQERTVELPPRRGAILDREGRPLAVTAAADSVFAIPSELDQPEPIAQALAPILGIPARDLVKKLGEADRDFVWLARRVPAAVARQIRARALPGVRLLQESTRKYPQGSLAAALLGYVGMDNQGLAGLEYRYDREIRGRPARVTFLRDAAQRSYAAQGRGRWRTEMGEEVEGESLLLTLDAAIQYAAEQELAKAVSTWHARGGSIVVLDPSDGAVLALASAPGFDPNRFADADPEARRNHPIADLYEPGSTFKIFAAAAALEAGTVGPDDLIDCGGGILTIGSTTIHEHGNNHWGVMPLADVIAHSSNIGIAHVALGLGKAPYYRTVRSFGFGQKSGLDLEGESIGLLRDVSSWSALTLPTMAFGQEVGVTVLQMARAYAAIASGGVLPTPYLVSAIRRADGRVEQRAPAAGKRVISELTAATVRSYLTRVVENGTGRLSAIPGFTVAGKTGTAQKAAPGGGYSHDRFIASFIGFVPAESPRAVIAVVIDEPKGKIYGGDVAAPAFSALGAETLRILREAAHDVTGRVTPAFLTADLSSLRQATIGPVLGAQVIPASLRDRGHGDESGPAREVAGEVPDLVGMSGREAVRNLARAGLGARLTGSGFVVSQSPLPRTPAEPGTVCSVILSLETPPTQRTQSEDEP